MAEIGAGERAGTTSGSEATSSRLQAADVKSTLGSASSFDAAAQSFRSGWQALLASLDNGVGENSEAGSILPKTTTAYATPGTEPGKKAFTELLTDRSPLFSNVGSMAVGASAEKENRSARLAPGDLEAQFREPAGSTGDAGIQGTAAKANSASRNRTAETEKAEIRKKGKPAKSTDSISATAADAQNLSLRLAVSANVASSTLPIGSDLRGEASKPASNGDAAAGLRTAGGPNWQAKAQAEVGTEASPATASESSAACTLARGLSGSEPGSESPTRSDQQEGALSTAGMQAETAHQLLNRNQLEPQAESSAGDQPALLRGESGNGVESTNGTVAVADFSSAPPTHGKTQGAPSVAKPKEQQAGQQASSPASGNPSSPHADGMLATTLTATPTAAGEGTQASALTGTGRVAATNLDSTADSGSEATFSALDADSAGHLPISIHGGARHAEAGFEDPALGWVGVRADLGGGGIHAAVVPDSINAAQVLSGHLAGLNLYLDEHRTPVETVTVTAPENRAAPDTGSGGNQNFQQGSGQGANQGDDRLSSIETTVAHTARMAPQLVEDFGSTPGTASRMQTSAGEHISVIA